jgi:hypothetical protein
LGLKPGLDLAHVPALRRRRPDAPGDVAAAIHDQEAPGSRPVGRRDPLVFLLEDDRQRQAHHAERLADRRRVLFTRELAQAGESLLTLREEELQAGNAVAGLVGVDQQEVGPFLVRLVKALQVRELAVEEVARETAENQHHGPAADQLAQAHRAAVAQGRQGEFRGSVAPVQVARGRRTLGPGPAAPERRRDQGQRQGRKDEGRNAGQEAAPVYQQTEHHHDRIPPGKPAWER